MTNQQDTALLPVAEADAIRFCEEALRNVDHLRLSRDDIEDIRGALQSFVQKRFAEQAKPSASGEAGEVERVAQWLHDEGGFDEAWSNHTWPEHRDDTGQRDGGFVRLVPTDVQAKFRDVARRLLRGRTLAALSERGAVGEEVEYLNKVESFGASFSREDDSWHVYTMEAGRIEPDFCIVPGYETAKIDRVLGILRYARAAITALRANSPEQAGEGMAEKINAASFAQLWVNYGDVKAERDELREALTRADACLRRPGAADHRVIQALAYTARS